MAQLDWDDACQRVKLDDGLSTRPTGVWSEDKLYVWHKYIQLTTSAMKGHPNFPGGLVYVDLFAGPGVCVVKGTEKRLPGSPLIAAMAPKPFSKIVLVEKDPELARACSKRMEQFGASTPFKVICGDSNDRIMDVVREIPPRALTLAIVDPEGLDAHWTTIECLAAAGRVDLMVLFADAYDAVRNLDAFLSGRDDRLDRMMGPHSSWQDRVREQLNWDGNKLRSFFSEEYCSLLKAHLEYRETDTKIIAGPNGPLYRLIFASKHARGLDFWRKVDHSDRQGQRGLFSP